MNHPRWQKSRVKTLVHRGGGGLPGAPGGNPDPYPLSQKNLAKGPSALKDSAAIRADYEALRRVIRKEARAELRAAFKRLSPCSPADRTVRAGASAARGCHEVQGDQ